MAAGLGSPHLQVSRQWLSAACRVFAIMGPLTWAAAAAPAHAQTDSVRSDFCVTNGQVNTVALSPAGDVLYIGGFFTQVGPATGAGVPIDASGGSVPASFPKVTGQVHHVVADGSGGWYIGGFFTAVGGLPRSHIAHIASNLTVTDWNPIADGAVSALAVSGSTVYVGGAFTSIGGQARNRIAAIDAATGAATTWNPNGNSSVYALAVSGSTVYVGGDFTSIGGQARNRIAAIDAATGGATTWNPNLNNRVFALAVSGSTVYAGGDFTDIGGQTRNYIASLDASTGAASAWNPNANGFIYALALNGSTVYAGGDFTSIGGQARNRIAALDNATGGATAWDPNANNKVHGLTVNGSTVYVGGEFTSIGGQPRKFLAALDATTGAASAWPDANNIVYELAVSGSLVYAGGAFTSIGGQTRNCIAAIDVATGAVTSWDPNQTPANAVIEAIAASGSTIYVAGGFSSIGGQARNKMAALDATTALATAWNPNGNNGSITDLAVRGSTVYACGLFTSIGGQSRNRVAALDATTGAVRAWNPNANSFIWSMAVDGSTVYVGGDFSFIGGQNRNRLAALDSTTGNATAWNPGADNTVNALAVDGSTVYSGGYFANIGGQGRSHLAAIDAVAGTPTAWNPGANALVRAIVVSDSTVYVAGDFTSVAAQPRNRLAALDISTGAPRAWDPDASGNVFALVARGSTTYAGGPFLSMGLLPQSQVAAIQSAWTITASAGTNGSTFPNGAVAVVAGQNKTFTFTPSPGYHVFDVLVDGAPVGPVSQYTFKNIQADHTIAASFAPNVTGLTTPAALVAADLDGDGKPDLATASATTSALSALRNTSVPRDILFAPKLDAAPDALPNGLAVVDLDGDGKLDLVTANRPDNTVSLNRNVGSPGTLVFATEVHWPVGSSPAAVAVGDVDRDGKPDLVVADAGSNSFTVLRNISNPGAPNLVPHNLPNGGSPQHVALVDLDGDGALDIVTANQSDNTVFVHRNISTPGSPQFDTRVTLLAASQPVWVAAADIDGDTQPDLVVANRGANSISVFRNTGALETISFAPRVDDAVGTAPAALALGDTDGDGRPDVVTANSGAATVSVLRNISPPGGVAFAPRVDQGVGATPLAVVIADFDADGKADIATADRDGGSLTVLRNSASVTVTASAGPGGSIEPAGVSSYADGATPTYYFRPNQQSKVQDVRVDGLSVGAVASYRFPALNVSHTIEVSFIRDPALAGSGWVPNGALVSGGSGDQQESRLVSDGVGGSFVVWDDAGDVFATRLNPAGVPQWNTVRMGGAQLEDIQQAVADGAGGVIVAFTSDDGSNNHDLYLQRVGPDGAVRWGANGTPLIAVAGQQSWARMVPDGQGGAFITWLDDPGGSSPSIHAQRVDSTGARLWGAGGVTVCAGTGFRGNPAIAVSGSYLFVTWYDGRSGNYDIYAQRVDGSGTVGWTANGVDITPVAGDQAQPTIVTDWVGGVVIAWQSDTGPGTADIFAQRLSLSGTELWAPGGIVLCSASGDQLFPQLAPGPIVAWQDRRAGPDADIYAQRVNPAGVPQWATDGVPVCAAIGAQEAPEVLSDDSGGALIAWYDGRNTGPWDVYAQHVDFAGTAQWTQDGLPVGVATGVADDIHAASNADYDWVFSWTDYRSGTGDIYAQRVTRAGVPGFDLVVTASASGSGAIAPAGAIGVFDSTSQTFTFTPTGDHHVLDVLVDGSSAGAVPSYTFQILAANHTIAASFAVNAPVIASVSPAAAAVGASVTLKGRYFGTTPALNIVRFGGVRAAVTAASSDTQLTVTVPTGAAYAPISVTTANLTVYSTAPFNVTFPSAGRLDSATLPQALKLPAPPGPSFVTAGDLDGDGWVDLLATLEAPDSIVVFRNTSSGGLAFERAASIATSNDPHGTALGDLDGDGRLDLAVTTSNGRMVSVSRNVSATGSIQFQAPVDLELGPPHVPQVPLIRDLDLDGKPDLIASDWGPSLIHVWRNTTVDSSLSFGPPSDLATPSGNYGVAVGDLDGDGRPDIVVGGRGSTASVNVSVFRNVSEPGTIAFAPRFEFSAGDTAYYVALADFDRDGRLDVVTSNKHADGAPVGSLTVFHNQSTVGSLSFVATPKHTVGPFPRVVVAGDLDGDAYPDIAVVNLDADSISVIRNLGQPGGPSFADRADLATGDAPFALTLADLDGDGRPEPIAAGFYDDSLTVFRNLGSYAITASAGVNGAVSPSGTVAVPGGASQTFLIQPNQRARVLEVVVDGIPQGPITRYTFSNVIGPHTVSATFVNDTTEAPAPFKLAWGSLGTGNGQFTNPVSVAVAANGDVYVTDDNHRVQKFDSTGTFLIAWGTQGSGNGQFEGPPNIAVDPSGNVYVADNGNDRIQKFSSDSTYLTQWGSSGTGDGQFTSVTGIAVDADGNVYVADNGNDRIQKFTSAGAFITAWGSFGSGDGQFADPQGVAVDASGDVYVGDWGNHRVQKFSRSGAFLAKWGSQGTGDGQFDNPAGVAVDGDGGVYVADWGNHRIQKFNTATIHINATLPPGVAMGFPLGPSSLSRGYVIEVSPIDPSIGGASVYAFVEPEFDGTVWNDVARVTLNAAPAPVAVDIRVHTVVPPATGDVDILMQPGAVHGLTLGPAPSPSGYVVDVSPTSASANGANVLSFVQPESNGSAWNDVARIQLLGATSPVTANLRSYAIDGPLLGEFDVVLQPGVAHGFYIGPAPGERGYVIDVTPSDVAEGGANARARVLAEYDGVDWGDVARIQLQGATNPVNAHIRVYAGTDTGMFRTRWGAQGSGAAQFDGPGLMVADAAGNVYVADSHNHRIQKFGFDHRLTITAGPGGAVAPFGTVGVIRGSSQAITATPATGYAVAEIRVDGVPVGTGPSDTLANITTDHTVVVTFAPASYAITASAETGGAITPSGSMVVAHGASRTYSIMPNYGSRIDNVFVDGSPIGPVTSYTFENVAAAHTVTATFTFDSETTRPGWMPNGAAVSRSTGSEFASERSAVADGAGGTYLVWADERAGVTNRDLYAQRLNPSGQPMWDSTGRAVCTAGGQQVNVVMVPDGQGGAVAVWGDGRDAPNYAIHAQRLDANGPLWAANGVAVVPAGSFTGNLFFDAASDGAGGAIVAWQRSPSTEATVQRVDSTGALLWGPGVSLSSGGAPHQYIHVAADGAGGAIVVWQENVGLPSIIAQRVNASGIVQWASGGVAVGDSAGTPERPALAVDAQGRAIVAWDDQRLGGPYAQRLDASGARLWGGGVPLSTTTPSNDREPRVVLDPAGGAFVAWNDTPPGALVLQHVDSTGTRLLTPERTYATGVGTALPTIAADGQGGAILAWGDNRSGNLDAYAQRVDGAALELWTAGGLPLCTGTGSQTAPTFARDSEGGAVVSLANQGDLFAQRVSPTGTIGFDHTLSISAAPHGTVQPAGTIGVWAGSSQLVTPVPDLGYEVAEIRVDGALVSTGPQYTVPNIAANHAIEVSFVPSTAALGTDAYLVLSHGFDDPQGTCQPRGWVAEDLATRVYAHVTDRVAGLFPQQGARTFWFGADSTVAPNEIANWTAAAGYPQTQHGFGNNWSQRLISPTFSLAANPNARLTFDASLRFDESGQIRDGNRGNEFLAVQALKSDGTWAFLNTRWTGVLTDTAVAGQSPGAIFPEVWLDADGNQALTLAETTQLRIVVQTDSSGSNEDGAAPGFGAVVIDNLRLRQGAADIIAATDFESGTTGVWTRAAMNGVIRTAGANTSITRDLPAPGNTAALRSTFDPHDPTCVWTFAGAAGDTVPPGSYARIRSPWFALASPGADAVISFTAKLNTLNQWRFVRPMVRGKNIGDLRPRFAARLSTLMTSGTSGADADAPLLVARELRFPQDFSGAQSADSLQIVFQLEDRAEMATAQLPRPPTRLPFLDDVRVHQLAVDSDGDGVANALDACPTVSAAGEDADGDGCLDSTATMRHVEMWTVADRPIRFRLSASGSPTVYDDSDLEAIREAFAAWSAISGSSVTIVEDPATPQTDAAVLDGVNLVTFADNYTFPSNVLAITTTTSFTRRESFNDRAYLPGQIADADMLFNPDATFGTATTGDIPSGFDLKSVAMHEVGHYLGLSHSGVLDATMFPVLQPMRDAANLEDDDRAALASAYPTAELESMFASIKGVVRRGGTGDPGLPVPGALVIAVRLDGGGVPVDSTASDFTREDGSYALYRLPPARYGVRIVPLDGSVPGLLPGAINPRVLAIAETDFAAEWWSTADSDSDDVEVRTPIPLVAGQTRTGIDLVTTIDVTAPAVLAVAPGGDAQNLPVDTPVLISFSEGIDAETFSAAVSLRRTSDDLGHDGRGRLIQEGRVAVLTPSTVLEHDTEYEVRISTALADRAGVHLASPYSTRFRTEALQDLATTGVLPFRAPRGAVVTLRGLGFDAKNPGVNLARFDCGGCPDVPALSVTPTSMSVVVPVQAVSGPIRAVRGSDVSVTSTPFEVVAPLAQLAPTPSGSPIDLGFEPTDVALTPGGDVAIAAGEGGTATIRLDTRVVDLRAVERSAHVAMRPDRLEAYVSQPDSHRIVVMNVDLASGDFGSLTDTIPVNGAPGAIAFSPDGRRAFVADREAGVIHHIATDALGGSPLVVLERATPGLLLAGGMAVDATGTTLYFTTANAGLQRLDLAADSVIAVGGEAGGGAAISPDNREALFPSATGLLAVRGALPTGAPATLASVPLPGLARDVAMGIKARVAYVANSLLDRLQVVDLDTTRASYRTVVGSVATDRAPVAVAASSDGSVIAVANAGGSVSIYQLLGGGGLVRVTPGVAVAGEQAAVVAGDTTFTAGTMVDVGEMLAPVTQALGGGATFHVPVTYQRATTVTLVNPSANMERTLALPFQIVDSIEAVTPRATSIVRPAPPVPCIGGSGFTPVRSIHVSPGGDVVAVLHGAANVGPCVAPPAVTFWQASERGPGMLGDWLTTDTLLVDDVFDAAFTADGTRLWVATVTAGTHTLRVLDADPASGGFGTLVEALGTPAAVAVSRLGSDPLGRWMIAASAAEQGVWRLDPAGAVLDSFDLAPRTPLAIAPARDGRHLVLGVDDGALFYDCGPASHALVASSHPGVPVTALAVTRDGRRAVGRAGASQFQVWSLEGTVGQAVGSLVAAPSPLGALVPGPAAATVLAGCDGCPSLFELDASASPPPLLVTALGRPGVTAASSLDGRGLWLGVSGGAPAAPDTVALHTVSAADRIQLVSGNGQLGPPGTALPVPVRVQLTSSIGHPQQGAVVRFALPDAGNGAFVGHPGALVLYRITDVAGEAAVAWEMPGTVRDVSLAVQGEGVTGGLAVQAGSIADASLAAPVVLELVPASGDTGIRVSTPVLARFSQRMDSSSVSLRTTLTANGNPVEGRYALVEDGRTLRFQPLQPLPFGAACVLAVAAGALDEEGQALAADASTSFVTESQPPLALARIDPPASVPGTPVVLSGTGFSAVAGRNTVLFAGPGDSQLIAPVSSASDRALVVEVPHGAITGNVVVAVDLLTSNTAPFEVLEPNADPGVPSDPVEVPVGCRTLAVTPEGDRAYLANPHANSVAGVALDVPFQMLAIVPAGHRPVAIEIMPWTELAYVANFGSHDVSVIDVRLLSTDVHEVVETIPVGRHPVDLAISPARSEIVVVCAGDSTIRIIDGEEGNATFQHVTKTVKLGSGGTQVVISADGTFAYVATADGVDIVDLTTDQVTRTVKLGSGGTQVVISADGTLLFVLTGDGTLAVIDIATGSSTFHQVVKSTKLGSGGTQVVISADGTLLLVSFPDRNEVLVFRIRSSATSAGAVVLPSGPVVDLEPIATIAVGDAPAGLAADPHGEFAVVVNEGAGTIMLIPLQADSTLAIEMELKLERFRLSPFQPYATVYLEPAPPRTPAQIQVASLRLAGLVSAGTPGVVGDRDGDTVPDIALGFLRTSVLAALPAGPAVPVTVTGLLDGVPFVARDTVRVRRGEILWPPPGTSLNPGTPTWVLYDRSLDSSAVSVAVLHTSGSSEQWILDGSGLAHNGRAPWTVPATPLDSVRVAVVMVDQVHADTTVTGVVAVSGYLTVATTLDVGDARPVLALAPIAPNPAQGAAALRFSLSRRGPVTLEVMDVQGRRVRELVRGELEAGAHAFAWRGETARGVRVGAGIYFLRLRAEGRALVRRFVWMP